MIFKPHHNLNTHLHLFERHPLVEFDDSSSDGNVHTYNEIFNHKFEVDFEKEILILRLFSATNCSYSLSEVKIDNNVLQIIYKRVVNVTTVPQRTAILIKMDKIEYEKIEFMCDVSYKNSRGKIKWATRKYQNYL